MSGGDGAGVAAGALAVRRAVIAALPGEAGRMRRRRAPATRLYLSGMGAEAARQSAERAVADGCALLVSWGGAAGLDPGLRCGDLVVGRRVWSRPEASPIAAAPAVVTALVGALPSTLRWQVGDLAHTPVILETPAAKRALLGRTGAHLADMETAAIAEVAERAGVAWAALRVVVDEASRPVCGSLTRSLGGRSRVRIGRLAWEVARTPAELPDIARLARAYRLTRQVLEAAAHALAW